MTVRNSHLEDDNHRAKEEDDNIEDDHENRDCTWRMMMEGIKSRTFNNLEDDEFEEDDGRVEKQKLNFEDDNEN